jgi:hypothetical protein
MEALRAVLRGLRDDAQGGYDDVDQNGKFTCERRLRATAGELDALFRMAGIRPDPIVANGTCRDCVFGNASLGQGDLGWAQPCCGCSRPKMTNFVPLSRLKSSELVLTADQATFLENVRDCKWWMTGLTTKDRRSDEWHKEVQRGYAIERTMKERHLMAESLGRRYLTRKGELALKRTRGSRTAA